MLDPTLEPILIEDETGSGGSTGSGETTVKAEPTGETFEPAPADGGGGTMPPPPLTYSSGGSPPDGSGGSPPDESPQTGFFPGVTAAEINPLFIFVLIGIAILMFNTK